MPIPAVLRRFKACCAVTTVVIRHRGRCSRFDIWVIVHFLAAVLALVVAKSGGIGVKDFVFGAMTGSFLTAPLFAWMAMDTINSNLVPIEHRYGRLTQSFCWFGLVFLSGFSLLFIGRFFFGFGA